MLVLLQFVVVVLIIWFGWKLLFPQSAQQGDLGGLIEQKNSEILELKKRRAALESEIGMTDKMVALDQDIEKALSQLVELEQQWESSKAP